MTLTVLLPVLTLLVAPATAGTTGCSLDCSLNGKCATRLGAADECSCNPGWKGPDCGTLDLLPVSDNLEDSAAYGTFPSSTTTGLAAWGGSVLPDPSNGSLYHGFFAEMALDCGLTAWYRNSMVVHATASTPTGPFTRQDLILNYFAHEPTAVALPNGSGYVLYKIGCADGGLAGSNGTKLVGPCRGCRNGTTEGLCPHPDQSFERACQDVMFAKSLTGPWTRKNLSLSNWNWKVMNIGLESHGPVVHSDGSILTFIRSWDPPRPLPESPIFLVRANQWDGEYVGGKQPFPNSIEDSHMFRDAEGNYHALFHDFDAIGRHAYSADGDSWKVSSAPAYGLDLTTVSGKTLHVTRRERPHLLLDPSTLAPRFLYNGATTPPGDFSFTLVQAVRG